MNIVLSSPPAELNVEELKREQAAAMQRIYAKESETDARVRQVQRTFAEVTAADTPHAHRVGVLYLHWAERNLYRLDMDRTSCVCASGWVLELDNEDVERARPCTRCNRLASEVYASKEKSEEDSPPVDKGWFGDDD